MMKRKFLIPMVALLLCVGMCSVGFAAWVITTSVTQESNGNFKVYSVENKSLFFAATPDEDKINFGGATGYTPKATDWLTWETGTNEDGTTKLTSTITIQLKDKDGNNITSLTNYVGKDLIFNVTFTANTSATYEGARTNNYITGPVSGTTITYTADVTSATAASCTDNDKTGFGTMTYAGDGKFTFTVDFGWGTALCGSGYTHPLAYFNAQTDGNAVKEGTQTWAEYAEATLGAFYASGVNNLAYTVEIVGTVQ